MARLVGTITARQDLAAIGAYISADSPAYAFTFLRRIIEAGDQLSNFPLLGREVPEFQRTDLREVIFQHYRIVYMVRDEGVFIIAVYHAAMDVRERLPARWELQ